MERSFEARDSAGRRKKDARRAAYLVWLSACLVVFAAVVLFSLIQPRLKKLRRYTRRGLKWYIEVLHRHPLSGRALTAGLIFTLADVCAQKLAGTEKFSYKRVVKYSLYGFGFMGPFLYGWYSLMHKYAPGDSFLGSVSKALFEQVTLEPTCIFCYIIYDGIYTRKTRREIEHKIRTQFFGLWCKNAMFWVPGNWANYYLGTPDLRVVFANMCSFWWNTYFSVAMAQIAATSAAESGTSASHSRSEVSGAPSGYALQLPSNSDGAGDVARSGVARSYSSKMATSPQPIEPGHAEVGIRAPNDYSLSRASAGSALRGEAVTAPTRVS
mmetsp:Transcript_8810/g.23111  ORF Transcript_8810/g.23111 Transcript_8810/m.23111 type:complete len:326 (+) Transcript_8810:42-1019(+)